jgi:hypothetical protein
MDNLVFEESVNAEITDSEFISKKWVYVNDNNSQNYSSQIILDTTPLSNSGAYVDWKESYMVMPLVVQLSSTNANSLPAGTQLADWSWGFKNGFWHMINSMTVEFNNQNVVQQTPFLNVFRSFKAETTFSKDDVENHGASIGFSMDGTNWCYNTSATTNSLSPQGLGLANNRNGAEIRSLVGGYVGATAVSAGNPLNVYSASPVCGVPIVNGVKNTAISGGASVAVGSPSFTNFSNEGLYQRQSFINYDPDANTSGTPSTFSNVWTGQSLLNPLQTFKEVYASGKAPLADQTAGSVTWYVYAKLRLKDLADYFDKLPLLKGSTMRFYINTNQTIMNFTTTNAVIDGSNAPTVGAITTPARLVVNSPVNINGGLTNPLMVASNDVGQGCWPLPADTYALSVSIFKNNNTGLNQSVKQTPLSSVRLYAPIYKFNPLAEQRYLSLAPQKRIDYNDIFQYQFSNISAGDSFNFLVTNGLQNIQSVLVVPFINSASNGVSSASTPAVSVAPNPLPTLISGTTCSGAMPDPIALSNFNILVSGVNLFLNNELYDYEQFRQELMSSNQLNGNLTSGLTSGLISEQMFSRGYRWYYGNCARILPSEEGVSRSVQIIGQNKSAVPCDLMVFVEFKKSMTIDISTGARID